MMEFKPAVAPLFVPADRPDRYLKAATSGADAVIVDLEDAVAMDRKEIGRESLPAALTLDVPVFIRINPAGSPFHEADIVALRELPFPGIVIPKVENSATIEQIDRHLGGGRHFIALIESARGVQSVHAIARCRNVRQLAFGPADYALDLGIEPNQDAMSFALSLLVLASRAEGLPPPLDGPYMSLGDQIGPELTRARRLGASGKLCIHPLHVAFVREAFRPSQDEITRAHVILASGTHGQARLVDGKLVDRPVVEWAKQILSRAGSIRDGATMHQPAQ
jgi:citrate lyase subunit beta / citryl-CoA lyase